MNNVNENVAPVQSAATTENEVADVFSKEKEEALAAGWDARVIAFVFDVKGNKELNSEGLGLGDKITITGEKPTAISSFEGGSDYLAIPTSGARQSVSLGRLVGTTKEKYFNPSRNTEGEEPVVEIIEGGYNRDKVLETPRKMMEALNHICTELAGHTLQVVAIAHNCGRDEDRDYFRFVDLNA